MWWLSLALAGTPEHPALEAVERGDHAWFTGDRRAGAKAWREAVREADASPEGRAAEAMARVRLLRAGSNLSVLFQAGPIDKAWWECPSDEPWCAVSRADFDLLAPEGLGANRKRVPSMVAGVRDTLPAQAASRLALATGDPQPLLDVEERDGLGRALTEGWVDDPGPWLIGVGVVGGAATGGGAGVHVVHPDLFRKRVFGAADAFGAQHAWALATHVETPGRIGALNRLYGARWRWFDGTEWVAAHSALADLGPVVRLGRWRLEAGPRARWDTDSGTLWAGHGAFAGVALDLRDPGSKVPKGARFAVDADVSLVDYTRTGVVGDARGYVPVASGVVAGRLRGEVALGDMPEVRLPAVGGPSVHRGRYSGELRGMWTATADLEVRHPVFSSLWLAAFVDVAGVEGAWEPGAGGGLRWVLPPQPYNTIRFDLGIAAGETRFHVAWGEAF